MLGHEHQGAFVELKNVAPFIGCKPGVHFVCRSRAPEISVRHPIALYFAPGTCEFKNTVFHHAYSKVRAANLNRALRDAYPGKA